MNKIILTLIIVLIVTLLINSCRNHQPIPNEQHISNEIPTSYILGENPPSPFSPTTTITYSVPDSINVIIVIYNVVGEIVDTIENQFRLPGTYRIEWDAIGLDSGIYLYRLTAGEFTDTKKMVLLK